MSELLNIPVTREGQLWDIAFEIKLEVEVKSKHFHSE